MPPVLYQPQIEKSIIEKYETASIHLHVWIGEILGNKMIILILKVKTFHHHEADIKM